jgi:hypothetical protein
MTTHAPFVATISRRMASALRGLTAPLPSKATSGPAPITETMQKSVGPLPMPTTQRALRWAAVKHLDQNAKARRQVQEANAQDLLTILRRGS